ncbi:MAG: tetratricopeptide repeat protein, partial [Isosphaeraceae bacterium]
LHTGKPDQALAEFRRAVALKPDLPEAHNDLGACLRVLGKFDEAIQECQRALVLRPDYASAVANLASVYLEQGNLEQAITEFHRALAPRPDSAEIHNKLGGVFAEQGKWDEAISAFQRALALKPDDAEIHGNLGVAFARQEKLDQAIEEFRRALALNPGEANMQIHLGRLLRRKGQYADALAAFRQAHDLESRSSSQSPVSGDLVRETERMVELEKKVPAIKSGKATATNAAESALLARMFSETKLYGASARFWAEAFQTQPALAHDMSVRNRYNAACAAALAGCGQGKDEPPLDEAARARWRKQAVEWLKADLEFWTTLVSTGPSQTRQLVAQTLQHWKGDPDLARVRDEAALVRLPQAERKAWQAFWADVALLLRRAQGDNAPPQASLTPKLPADPFAVGARTSPPALLWFPAGNTA